VGSVRMITDANGQEVTRYDFWPFGQVSGSPAVQDPRMFVGEEHDGESGFDYLGARYYAGTTGRFITPDDPAYMDPANPQSLNRYAYTHNNPLRWVDPTGHDPQCPTEHCETVTVTAPMPPNIGLLQFLRDSWVRPWGTAAQQVAQPVTDWLTAPRDPACLAGAAGIGASMGGVAGGIIGGAGGGSGGAFGGTLVAPGVGTIGGGFVGGTAGFAQGTAAGALAGGAVGGAIGSVACMASGGSSSGGSGGNRQENRAFREAIRRIERALGKNLRPDQVDQLHREISKQNYTLQEIVELGTAMFR
jgi:RHS repeat-associated protein